MTTGIILSNLALPYLVNYLPTQMGYFLAISLKCVAYIFYLEAKHSFFLFFLGTMISFGEYICQYKSQFDVVSIFPSEKGKIVGLMISGIALNVLFWSTVITQIVNPLNLPPNEDKIFPIEVAQNFSRFIYIFNISNFLLGLLGIYLIKGI